MERNTMRAALVVCVSAMVACSGTPHTMLSPSAASTAVTFVNADGSMVKASAPTDLGPAGGITVGTVRPTLTFTNPVGVYATVGFAYDIEVRNAGGAVVYARTIGESPVSGSHTLETDLAYSENHSWSVRARLGTQVGPAANAQFRTYDRPGPAGTTPPTVVPGGGLPFPVPASCLAGNGAACSFEIAGVSAEWARCRAGDGTGCHRFTRQVVYALSLGDPNWMMIQAAPGGHACNCSGCGPSDGTMFREDTTVYGGRDVYDMIVGAGGPAPGLSWNFVGAPRNVDVPNSAPLCQ